MIPAEQGKIHADYRKRCNIEHSKFIADLIASHGFVQSEYEKTVFHLNREGLTDEDIAQLA